MSSIYMPGRYLPMKCIYCGETFEPKRYDQIFCCKACGTQARKGISQAEYSALCRSVKVKENPDFVYHKAPTRSVCSREDCQLWFNGYSNKCKGLSEIIKKDCPFYKPK